MTMKEIAQVMSLAEKYYPKNKLKHAIRVANYAYEDAKSRNNVDTIAAFVVGIAHDLLEDTECSAEELESAIGSVYLDTVVTLTKDEVDTYADYIESIFTSKNNLAILVKKADMKDHFMQEDTLTDKLLKKYLPYIKEFL